jgi:hypothetical protein
MLIRRATRVIWVWLQAARIDNRLEERRMETPTARGAIERFRES